MNLVTLHCTEQLASKLLQTQFTEVYIASFCVILK